MEKKKKIFTLSGFTLMELLAVIVILGLLIGIAVPSITKNINETRSKTYNFHEADMKTSTANMMSDCLKNGTDNCVPSYGETRTYYLSDLISSRYSDVLKDPADANKRCDENLSYVVVKNTGVNVVDLDYSVCLVCSDYASGICEEVEPDVTCDRSSDTTEPECGTPTGASTEWINTDRLISIGCSDSGCGCSQDTYYKRFSETGKTGTITISDKSNSGNPKECPVNVYIDKEKPECTLEVEGQLGENGWYGGDSVIVRMVDRNDEYNGESLSGVATYGLGTSKANPSYNKKTSIEVSPGITTIYGYVKDNAGNENYCSIRVQYDSEKPTQSIKYGYQVYPKDDMLESTSGSVINLKNYTSEYGDIVGAMVYLKSNANGISSVTFKNGSTVLATRTMANDITFMEFTFTASGLYNDISIDMGSSSNINLIEKIELVTAHVRSDSVEFYTNKDMTVYVDSLDTYSGKAQYSFDGQNTWSRDNKEVFGKNYEEIKVNSKDGSGNISNTTTIKINNIDKLEPICVLQRDINPYVEDWYKSKVVVSFKEKYDDAETTDYSMSGMRDYSMNANGLGSPKTSSQETATAGTVHPGYILDKAGNIGTCSTTIKLDLTDPTVGTVNIKKTNSSGIDVTTSASDGGIAKVNTDVYVKLNNGSDTGSVKSGHYITTYTVVKVTENGTTTVTTDETEPVTYKDEGTYTVTVKTTDKSNRSSTKTYKFMIDKTIPTCSVAGGTTTWKTGSRKITVTCRDTDGIADSGCTADSSYEKTYDTTTKTAVQTVYDVAGNKGICTANVYIDNTAPVCEKSENASTTWTKDNRTIKQHCSDGTDQSGCTKATYDTLYNVTTKTSSVVIEDMVGNKTTCNYDVYVDKTAPECGTPTSVTTWTNADRTIKQPCSDGTNQSGCAKATYEKTYTDTQTNDTITISDGVGNTNTCTYKVWVDKEAPTCTLKVNTTNGVEFATKTDTGGSEISEYDVTKSATASWDGTSVSKLALSSGTFYGHVKDNAGNTTKCNKVLVNAIRHDKETVKECKRYISSYTCSYTGQIKYTETVKTCTVSYTCSRAAIPHYATCSSLSAGECSKYYGCTYRGYCTGTNGDSSATGTFWSCSESSQSTTPPGGCMITISTPCGGNWGLYSTNYGTTTSTTQNKATCTPSGSSFTSSDCESNTSLQQVTCNQEPTECLFGSGFTIDGDTCTKNQSSATCDYGTSSANYSYYWNDTETDDVTDCSASTAFSCYGNNHDKSYTICDFIKYECTSDMGTLVGGYCYK